MTDIEVSTIIGRIRGVAARLEAMADACALSKPSRSEEYSALAWELFTECKSIKADPPYHTGRH